MHLIDKGGVSYYSKDYQLLLDDNDRELPFFTEILQDEAEYLTNRDSLTAFCIKRFSAGTKLCYLGRHKVKYQMITLSN